MNFQLRAPRIPHTSVVEQVFINRGIPANEVNHYLNTSESDVIAPSTITNIEAGAKMLVSHIAQNHKVMVQIDSDCDGFTSAAVLINYLNCLFPGFVQNNIFYRPHTNKAHGIIPETVPEDVKLVIAPDSSSNEFEIHKSLHDRGIDVLVIDHHNTSHFSEYACVINNQLCDYPTKSLSGVGMVYKFCCYLDELLQVNYAEQYLDLVALGIIADVMDLRDFETRYLVDKGCANIRNPFLKGMVAKQDYSLKGKVTPHGAAFYIVPGLNAITRVGTLEERQMLFESMLEFRAYEQVPSTKRGCKGQMETRVEQACRNCTNVRNRQTKQRDASLEIIRRLIEENNLLENQVLAVKLEGKNESNRDITGLIANIVMGQYQRPVLILNRTVRTDDSGNSYVTWDGSGRNANGTDLTNFQEFLNESGYFEFAEGHDNAFGVSIRDENFDAFIEWSNEKLKGIDFTPKYKPDVIYFANMVHGSEILKLADLGHIWGQGVEEPIVVVTDVKVDKSNLNLFGSTLKIALPSDEGISLVKFRSSNEEYENLYSELGCVTINVVGKCSRNSGWDDKPQIIIDDYEIVGRTAYYF